MTKLKSKPISRETQLILQILKFKLDPLNNDFQTIETVNKLINLSFRKAGKLYFQTEEDNDDFVQEAKSMVYNIICKKLSYNELIDYIQSVRTNPCSELCSVYPTLIPKSTTSLSDQELNLRDLNKRVYNYITISLRFLVRNKINAKKKILKIKEFDYAQSSSLVQDLKNYGSEPYPGLFENESLERIVSIMLSEGYTRIDIKRELKLSTKKLQQSIEKIKEVLNNINE
jgi:hypothetical protein